MYVYSEGCVYIYTYIHKDVSMYMCLYIYIYINTGTESARLASLPFPCRRARPTAALRARLGIGFLLLCPSRNPTCDALVCDGIFRGRLIGYYRGLNNYKFYFLLGEFLL